VKLSSVWHVIINIYHIVITRCLLICRDSKTKVIVYQLNAIIYILHVKCIFQHLLHMFPSFNVVDFCSVAQMLYIDLYFMQSCRSCVKLQKLLWNWCYMNLHGAVILFILVQLFFSSSCRIMLHLIVRHFSPLMVTVLEHCHLQSMEPHLIQEAKSDHQTLLLRTLAKKSRRERRPWTRYVVL